MLWVLAQSCSDYTKPAAARSYAAGYPRVFVPLTSRITVVLGAGSPLDCSESSACLKDGSDPSGLSRPSGNLQSPRPLTRDSSPETTRTKVLTLYSLIQVPGSKLAGRSASPCHTSRTVPAGVHHGVGVVRVRARTRASRNVGGASGRWAGAGGVTCNG